MKPDIQHLAQQDFKSIVESSNDVIMRFDLDHRHLYVNKAVEVLTGISQQDFIGSTHEELGFPQYLCDLWGEAIDHVFESQEVHRIEFSLPNGIVIDWALVPEFDHEKRIQSVITTARDITESKISNEQLLENEKRFKDAFKLANLATWEIDVLNAKVILNKEFCQIIGVDWKTSGDAMTRSEYFQNMVHDEDKERFLVSYHEAIESSDHLYESIIEYRVIRPSGEVIWMYATIRIGINSDGLVHKVYGTCQDITELKRNEDELQAHRLHLEDLVTQRTQELKCSQEKLADAVELANLSTWDFNLDTEEIRVEGFLEKKLTKDLFIKENVIKFDAFIEIIDPRDFKMFYEAFEKASKTSDEDYLDILRYRMYDESGNTRHLNLTIKVRLRSGDEVNTLYGTIQDITHIITSKSEKDRLNSIIEATSDIVAIFDADKNITYLNKAGNDFYNKGELSLKKGSTIEGIQNDICKRLLEDKIYIEVDEKGYWIGENFLHRYDDVEVPVSQIMIAHRLENGDIDCYSTIIRDISQLKQTEKDLKFKNNELDTFVYRVSHDLRGPIASMMGLYNVVTHEIQDKASLAFFEMYNKQIIRLNETIIALIDLTRIKEVTAESNEISFEEIVDGSIQSFTHLPGYENTHFEKTYKLHKTYSGDKSLLTTIIQNLIENAIKYSRPEVHPLVRILIEMTNNSNVLSINVTDNGRGIKKEIQGDVFNMFFRGDDSTAIGSGLGLYILKNAVEKLHGSIKLESKVNEGTSFTITIPIIISTTTK